MKISTEIGSIAKIVGMEKAVELCAKAGFDAWDFSMFDMCRIDRRTMLPFPSTSPLSGSAAVEFARKLKKIGLDNGIVCNQSHAPFPVHAPAVRDCLERAIECTAEAGGEICVIHPINNATAEQNAEMYAELLPFAKSCGVKIATENMYNWDAVKEEASFNACATVEDFNKHLDAINDDFFVACLDIGHAEMRGAGDGAVKMIQALGHRLAALHIHDIDLRHDNHQIPFSLNVDFPPIVKALKDIGYSGYFTLEAVEFLTIYSEDTVFDGVAKLQESAKKLAKMFEQA